MPLVLPHDFSMSPDYILALTGLNDALVVEKQYKCPMFAKGVIMGFGS